MGDADHAPTAKDLIIRAIPSALAQRVIEAHYYTGTWPHGNFLNFGVYLRQRPGTSDVLRGVCCYGWGNSQYQHKLFTGGQRGEVLELTRLWLADDLPRNSASRVVSVTLRLIRQHWSKIGAVVTLTEHAGHLYKGGGWLYIGDTFGDAQQFVVDGEPMHRLTMKGRFHTRDAATLRAQGHSVEVTRATPKRKFVYCLHSDWRDRLTAPVLAYGDMPDRPGMTGTVGTAVVHG